MERLTSIFTGLYKSTSWTSLDEYVKDIRDKLPTRQPIGEGRHQLSPESTAPPRTTQLQGAKFTQQPDVHASSGPMTPRQLVRPQTPSTVKPRTAHVPRSSLVVTAARRRSRKVPRKSTKLLARPSLSAQRATAEVELLKHSDFDDMCEQVRPFCAWVMTGAFIN